MKVSSHRRVRKYLSFYKTNFEFKSPYEVIVDGTFCLEALTCKLSFQEQVPKYLEDENLKLYTTSCVIKETQKLGKKGLDTLNIVKKLEVKLCDHKDPVPSFECLFSLVKKNNLDHFFIATQNQELINKCRSVASIPLLYVLNNTICLENPTSSRTLQVKRKANTETPKAKRKKPMVKGLPPQQKNKWTTGSNRIQLKSKQCVQKAY